MNAERQPIEGDISLISQQPRVRQHRTWQRVLRWNVLVVLAVVVVVIMLACAGGLLVFRYGYCDESSGPYVSSPGLDYYAQVRTRNCGVTTDWETEVVLRVQPSFELDKVPAGSQVLLGGDIAPEFIELEWKSERHLEVRYPHGIHLYKDEVNSW